MPADIPVSYVSAVNAKDTKFHLILGTVGSLNTEVITAPSFSRFQPYDSDKFALRRQVLGEIPMTANGVETEQHLVKIDQKFLQDRITGAQLLNKIK
ncbi:MAG: hypothetical protein LBD11_04640 [Candidatus Peribacteria bacterium]|nr:hypothetical protein [Candidatus Peribacteria bacterium]